MHRQRFSLVSIACVLAFAASVATEEEPVDLEAPGIAALKLSQTEPGAIVSAAIFFGKASAAYERAKDDAKATEMNSFLYWCKKKMTLQQMETFLKGGNADNVALINRMESVEKTSPLPSESKAYLDRAESYAKSHPDEHLLVAIRFFEVADRFKGSDISLQAMDLSLKEMQQVTSRPSMPATVPNSVNSKTLSEDAEKQTKRRDQLKTLDELAQAVKSPAEARTFITAAFKLLDEAIGGDDFGVAEKVLATSRPLSAALKDPAVIAQLRDRTNQVAAYKSEFGQAQRNLEILKTTPSDPKANLIVGKYFCFTKGDWNKGLPLFTNASDAVLKKLSQEDIAGSQDSKSWAALGDGWWELGEKLTGTLRRNVQHRAVGFYLDALPSLSDLSKLKTEKRIAEFFKNNADELFSFNPTAGTTELIGDSEHPQDNPDFGVLIGVKAGFGSVDGRPILRAFQPVFLTRAGSQASTKIGGGTISKEYMAKPGYAVASIVVSKGPKRLNGIKITYQRMKGLALDPEDSYDSEWIGDHKSSDRLINLKSEKSNMVVGVSGWGGSDFDELGLIFMKTYKIDAKR